MANILIIDDEPEANETLTDILEEEGYRVVSAETGAQGLEHAQRQPFHVVLLDLKLPDRNGLDILQDLVQLDPGQRVIVATGYATVENAIKALNQGAYAYITKPLNIEELKALINQAMAQRELAAQKKEVEEEVRRLKEYNENILTSLPDGTIIFDQSLTVEYVNAVYLQDFQLQWDEAIGKNLFEVLPFTHQQIHKIELDIERFLSGKAIDPQEIQIDQRSFDYRLFYVLRGILASQKIGLVIRDMTAEKKLQQQLIQSEKLAGIGTMAAGIAHEMNNPLFGIMGMAEAILDEEDPKLIKEYSEDIIKYSQSVTGIVKGLTLYSRSTEAGDLGLIDVNDKLDDAIKIVRHSLEFDGIHVRKEYKTEKKVMINSGEIQQVFVNIIHNAAQAMDGKGRLELLTRTSGNSVLVRISDDGPGIQKEHIGKIFDPFFTSKGPDKGTGLGLNIVYRIVQKYDGNIIAESEEGKGASFTITFPIGD